MAGIQPTSGVTPPTWPTQTSAAGARSGGQASFGEALKDLIELYPRHIEKEDPGPDRRQEQGYPAGRAGGG